jgi:hypothetical protein
VGYKIVKVRKADGTVVTVKRKLSPGEEATTTAPAQGVLADTSAASPSGESLGFKIVTVRKADGTLVKVRRPNTKQPEITENEKVTPKQADPQHVEPSKTAADAKSIVEKSTPTGITSVPAVINATTLATSTTDGSKEIHAAAPATVDTDKPETNNGSPDSKSADRSLADALAEQAIYNREKRTHRFKSSLLKGFGMAVGSALPSLELSHDFEDGDEILSDDDDYSVDDADDHDGHADDGDDVSNEIHARNEVGDGKAHEVDNSGMSTERVLGRHRKLTLDSFRNPCHVRRREDARWPCGHCGCQCSSTTTASCSGRSGCGSSSRKWRHHEVRFREGETHIQDHSKGAG